MNELLMNIQLGQNQLADLDKEMSNIAMFARAYANATPEQRARINTQDVQAQLDRYNTLKQQKLALQEELYANQLAYGRAQQEAQNIVNANNM